MQRMVDSKADVSVRLVGSVVNWSTGAGNMKGCFCITQRVTRCRDQYRRRSARQPIVPMPRMLASTENTSTGISSLLSSLTTTMPTSSSPIRKYAEYPRISSSRDEQMQIL